MGGNCRWKQEQGRAVGRRTKQYEMEANITSKYQTGEATWVRQPEKRQQKKARALVLFKSKLVAAEKNGGKQTCQKKHLA